MKIRNSVLLPWLLVISLLALTILILPTKGATLAGFVSRSIQALLFVITIQIIKREPTRKNKYIFVNFAVFFFLGTFSHVYDFIGPDAFLFTHEPYARLYVDQFVFYGLYFFICAFSIAYLTLDVLFRDFRTLHKYLVTFAIVGSFFGYYYSGYFADPKYTYKTSDILDWKALDETRRELLKTSDIEPTAEMLAERTQLHTWKNAKAVGNLYPEENLARVKALYPYLPGANYQTLVYKPIWFDVVHMCVVSIGFILLFFGYLYMKDPPQGAYIEKIMFLFFVMCSLEVLHSWTAIKTVEWGSAASIIVVGQYVSTIVFVLMAGAFAMRLRFITSIKGEFYEQELAHSPKGVTRWRDAMDNLVVEKFFNRKLILGRMFVESPTRRS